MSLESWPAKNRAQQALVALVVMSILDANDLDREALIQSFCATAWPSQRGMRQ